LHRLAGRNECRWTKKITIPPSVSYSAMQGINGTTKQANLVHRKNKLRLSQGPTPKREQIHPTLYEMPDRNLPPLCLVENYSSLVQEPFAREESARAAQRWEEEASMKEKCRRCDWAQETKGERERDKDCTVWILWSMNLNFEFCVRLWIKCQVPNLDWLLPVFFLLIRVNPSDPWPDHYTGLTIGSGLKTMFLNIFLFHKK